MSYEVSQIIDTVDADGRGLIGFTIRKDDGAFENILREYTSSTRDEVLSQVQELHQQMLDNTR